MSGFRRYAVYYLPEDDGLAEFGASWLGWDVRTGEPVPELAFAGIGEVTETPRRYGFHGTLKPPFFLAEGHGYEGLSEAVASFARSRAPLVMEGLRLTRLGRFLALVPEGDTEHLEDFAFDIVREFDRFRAPPDTTELERRRSAGLSARQEALLSEWGYPYVGPEFRFHLTLTGKLDASRLDVVMAFLEAEMPLLPRPFVIGSISLVGQGTDGMFRLIQRHALSG